MLVLRSETEKMGPLQDLLSIERVIANLSVLHYLAHGQALPL